MQIEVSKTDWCTLLTLIDKAVVVIQGLQPSTREYNIARRLRRLKNDIVRKNEKKQSKIFINILNTDNEQRYR